jgi:hypothetical protein
MKYEDLKMPFSIAVYLPDFVNKEYGSIRIRGINLVKYLSIYHRVNEINSLEYIDPYTYIILPQKAVVEEDLNKIKKHSNKTFIYDVCEFFIDEQRKKIFYKTIENIDVITVASYSLYLYLCSKTKFKKIYYIPDIVEVEFNRKIHAKKEDLKLFWYGFKENYENTLPLIDYIKNIKNIHLITMSNTSKADFLWDVSLWKNLLNDIDVGISPILQNNQFHSIIDFKSSHRITSFMAKGVPVIASPIVEYKNIIKPDYNGFLANTLDEWNYYIDILRNSDYRNVIGENSYLTALNYSGENVIKLWNMVFEDKEYLLDKKYINIEIPVERNCYIRENRKQTVSKTIFLTRKINSVLDLKDIELNEAYNQLIFGGKLILKINFAKKSIINLFLIIKTIYTLKLKMFLSGFKRIEYRKNKYKIVVWGIKDVDEVIVK